MGTPLMRGVEWLDPRTPIYVEDLLAWEEFARIRISSGDALFIRTVGWAKREADGALQYGQRYGQSGAALHASVLSFLHERDVAILIEDAVNNVQPFAVTGIVLTSSFTATYCLRFRHYRDAIQQLDIES